MMEWLSGIGAAWWWIALGLVLAAFEMIVPGVYLIWLALAALATGALAFVFDFGVAFQVIDFVFLSLIAIYAARRIVTERPIESSDPLLNNRMARLVGQTGTVSLAIVHGEGRINQGDSQWSARGPELPVGARVRIIGFDGGTLIVEPLTLLGDEAAASAADA